MARNKYFLLCFTQSNICLIEFFTVSSANFCMKYFYIKSQFIKEDQVQGFSSPITSFVEKPILAFSNHVNVKMGIIDLVKSKEYDMPIQLGNIIFRKLYLFKEKVDFLHRNYGFNNFMCANLQLIFVDKHYNPIKYILKDVVFEYVLAENFEYFLNVIIPFLNWGVCNNKDMDLILLFSTLLCKKEFLNGGNEINIRTPYLDKYFLDNLNVKQNFKFQNRVGRDDHAYEYTSLIFVPHSIEEYYFVKLVGTELAEGSIYPKINVKRTENVVAISYCSMFDDNALREQSREYSVEECNAYKNMLVDKFEELYDSFWKKFLSIFDEYKCYKSKEIDNCGILNINELI